VTAAPPPALSRAAVDRAAHHRSDDAWLAQAWARGAVLVVDDDGRVAVDDADEGPRLHLQGPEGLPADEALFLGEADGTAYFAVRGIPTDGDRLAGLREVGAQLGARDAGLLVTAISLTNWHARHTHCPRCGAPTRVVLGGWVRRCTVDGSEHYPRVDPAMIVLVHDGADRCLLGRQASWPPGRYSTLAGFVEPGESAEMAVVREVGEESGVAVRDVEYRASQPWPFPSSLMLGFRARADADATVQVDGEEIEDARWFTRAELLGDDGPLLPPPVSIAHRLITDWLAEG
jgi:NAD+ diphosphatase